MTREESRLSVTFCAVPAFMRVEPAIGFRAGIEQDAVIGLGQERRVRIVGDADRQRARAPGLAQAGERERRRAARRDRDQHVVCADAVAADELRRRARLVLGAFDRLEQRLLAAGHEQQQPLSRPAEGRRQLGAVLDGEPARGAGAGIDQAAAAGAAAPRWRAPPRSMRGARRAPPRRPRVGPRSSRRGCRPAPRRRARNSAGWRSVSMAAATVSLRSGPLTRQTGILHAQSGGQFQSLLPEPRTESGPGSVDNPWQRTIPATSWLARDPRGAATRFAARPRALPGAAGRARAAPARTPPQVVVTCARGSSAHAATFGKHLIERYLGIPVAAAAPNIATVYRRTRCGSRTSCSSPCRSPAAATISSSTPRAARAAGALTVGAGQRDRQPARRGLRHRAADGGRAGAAASPRPRPSSPRSTALLRLAALWTERRALRRAALDRLPERLAAARRWTGARRCDALATADEPGRDRPRPDARHRARGRAQAQGDLQPACRGLQRRRVPARAGGAGLGALSDPDVHADRCGARRACGSSPPTCAARARRCSSPSRASAPPAACRRSPPDHPEADAICLMQSFYGMAVRLARAARHRRRPAAPPAEGDAHAMTRARPGRRGRPRLRRR